MLKIAIHVYRKQKYEFEASSEKLDLWYNTSLSTVREEKCKTK